MSVSVLSQNSTTPRAASPQQDPFAWIYSRLKEHFKTEPKLEASLYGPIGSYLSKFFPVERRYLIKPRGAIQEMTPMTDAGQDELPDLYITSPEESEAEEEVGPSVVQPSSVSSVCMYFAGKKYN